MFYKISSINNNKFRSVIYNTYPKRDRVLTPQKTGICPARKKELYKMSAVCEKGLPTEKAGLSLII